MKQVTAKVIKNEQILLELQRPDARNILGSWIIWLRCPEIAREAKPGQFVMVNCGQDCVLPRPFSVHQVINKEDLTLYFAVLEGGKGTNWLSQREKGNTVEMTYPHPLGNGFSINSASHNLLLVAGGIGIAPLCFLAEQAVNQGYKVKLLRGASGAFKPSGEANPVQHYPESILPARRELKTITTSPDGLTGNVIELLKPEVVDWADQIFACGPLPMYQAMAQRPKLKDKPVQISLEVRMGCGRGVCYGCTVKTKRGLKQVCQDGPVFDLDDVLWDTLG